MSQEWLGISQLLVVRLTPPNSGKFPGFGPAASACQCRSLKPARHEIWTTEESHFHRLSPSRGCVWPAFVRFKRDAREASRAQEFLGPALWKWLFSVVKNIMPSRLQGPALADTGSWPKSWEFPRVWWCPAHHQTLGKSQAFLGQMEALVVPGLHDNFTTGCTLFHV